MPADKPTVPMPTMTLLLLVLGAGAVRATPPPPPPPPPSPSPSPLPVCPPRAVCAKLDLYEPSAPWLERQCACPRGLQCPESLDPADGHTLRDRTRLYKMCEPVRSLPRCRFFRDVTWSVSVEGGGRTQQVVQCACPRGAVAYLLSSRRPAGSQRATHYAFACSPQSKLRCSRKEPCRLFTARKRPELRDEVTTSSLCVCPPAHSCPRHHAAPGVVPGGVAAAGGAVRTYSAFCVPD